MVTTKYGHIKRDVAAIEVIRYIRHAAAGVIRVTLQLEVSIFLRKTDDSSFAYK